MTLDDIRTGSTYDLISLCQDSEDALTDNDSPFQYGQHNCDYYEPEEFRSMIDTNSLHDNTASYFHLNCRGLSSNWDSFKSLLCNLHGETFNFDLIGISEIFRTSDDMRLNLPGYHNLISRCRDDGPRGGVGLFIRENINYKIRDDISVFLPHIFESLFVEISYTGSKNIIVGVVYRPNTEPHADMDMFQSNMFDIMSIITTERKQCTIMGDMNINLLKFGCHPKTEYYLEGIFSHGFLPVIVKPTRITVSSATLIDHIYSNNITATGHAGIIITDLADHFGTFYLSKLNKINSLSGNTIKKIIFSDNNITLFINKLKDINFTHISHIMCPDEAYNGLMNLYINVFNESFPIVEIQPKNKHLKNEPWFTSGLRQSSKTKAKLFSKKLSSPSKYNIQNYREYNILYKKLQRRTKATYYENLLEINKHNIKKTWNTLRSLIGKTNDKSGFPNNFVINNNQVSDRQETAEAFNNFFSKIGLQTGENVPKVNTSFKSFMPNSIIHSIFLEPVSPSDVVNITHKLKSKTSFGHDCISTKLLKATIHVITIPLTHIINRSFETGIVPKDMKIAKVIPIYKSSDRTLLKNYRPISLLPVFSKVIEKLMYTKITSFLNANNLFYKHQYGFRENHSTVHPIIHLLNQCAVSTNHPDPEYTIAILCDLSKAFDVIRHDILLSKLNYYGIRGIANQWFRNYLSEREQYVEIDGYKSSHSQMNCGVPQGSILGPLLYLIYVNDINLSCNGSIVSFADDTTIYVSDSNIDSLYNNANTLINSLFNWFCANRLSLNANKTKYIVIRPPSLRGDLAHKHIYIHNTQLHRIGNNCNEKSAKFLGILIDENLTWKEHISHVNKKISRALFSIKQVKNVLPKQCLKTLYYSLIHSHLSYGILVWGNATQSALRQTTLLQKRAIRLINKAKYNSHTDPLFRISHVMKLNDLMEYEATLFAFDFKTKKLPVSFNDIFMFNRDMPNARLTRQSDQLYVAKSHNAFSSKLPLYNIPRTWNKFMHLIPYDVTRSQFKRRLKSHIFDMYPETVRCNNPRCNDCYL